MRKPRSPESVQLEIDHLDARIRTYERMAEGIDQQLESNRSTMRLFESLIVGLSLIVAATVVYTVIRFWPF